MTKTIKELTADKDTVTIRALIASVMAGKTNGNNKSNYLTIVLQDKSGTIDAKLWAAKPEQMETLKSGCVVDVTGDVIKYGDGLQFKIEKISIFSTDEKEQVKYIKSAPFSTDDMAEKLLDYVSLIKDPVIGAITQGLYEDHFEKLIIYPAASKNHHEYVSGLAHHTLSMLKMADVLLEVHPALKRDYLYAGILLHDLGKIIELSGPVVPEYTLAGKLLGHISIAQAMIAKKASELHFEDDERVILLSHLVLSHHGKMEYGSPVLPELMEAEAIYLLDNLDARINMIEKALDNVEDGHFSKRIFPLENRSFYKPKQ